MPLSRCAFSCTRLGPPASGWVALLAMLAQHLLRQLLRVHTLLDCWKSVFSRTEDAKPDHGDVLPSFLRALCDEKFRFFAQAAFLTLSLSGWIFLFFVDLTIRALFIFY